MTQPATTFRPDRHPSESYEDILDQDTRPVPAFLRQGPVPDIGLDPVPTKNYFCRDYFQKEIDFVWSRVWQIACREEEIPNIGDYHVYDIAGKSFIVVRSGPDTIQAFHNSCLHRARKLATSDGCNQAIRCPFHGFTWNIDGSFKENPIAWDFPQWEGKDMRLPEAKMDVWGGFVFINPDLNALPLDSYIKPLADDFVGYDYANRYKAVHVAKLVRCNWKIAAEAFMESHHAIATHPQILPFLADANSQYDHLSDYVTRQFSATGVPSPFVADENYTADEIVMAMNGMDYGAKQDAPVVPDGLTARIFAAEHVRQSLSAEDGWDYTGASDAEMLDALLYNLWPHMSFWASYAPNLVYRWRPNSLDPETSIMDVMILKRVPKTGPRPKAAVVRELGFDQPWGDAPELGALIDIFDQDMANLPYVQQGLHASATGVVHFGRYSEMRIRQMHLLIDRYIADGA
ncbi:MAG: aromatic ring-hydroxylating dioxygenase subunit alpha [Sphingorhabdus sp.]